MPHCADFVRNDGFFVGDGTQDAGLNARRYKRCVFFWGWQQAGFLVARRTRFGGGFLGFGIWDLGFGDVGLGQGRVC
jgi:hypothetical protein